jgi:DNA end-binding protein Ku
MVDLALELIERKSAPFDATAFEDHYADALRELIERKREDKAVVQAEDGKERRKGAQVIDLMEALKKSVQGGKRSKAGGGKKLSPKGAKGSKRASGGQRKAS